MLIFNDVPASAERILFGSDIPFGTMRIEKDSPLTIRDEKKEWIRFIDDGRSNLGVL